MTRTRLKPLPLSLLALVGVMILGATASHSPVESAPSPSPPADGAGNQADIGDLICHTNNPADCYPRIFQATDQFQTVHPDQELPQGLHVRLNINTGQKEAKINVLNEENPALAGLPVDSSVVLVDDPSSEGHDEAKPKIPPNAPAYDPVGKVKPPPKSESSTADSNAFYSSLTTLKKGIDIDGALEMLEEISHDIYYGLKIAEDYDTIRHLSILAHEHSEHPPSPPPNQDLHKLSARPRLAALILASAVQNNPKALAQIESHWGKLSRERGWWSNEDLGTAIFRVVPPGGTPTIRGPAREKIRLIAASGLLKSPLIRAHFLSHGGPEMILEAILFAESKPEWAAVQRQAALLLLDNFLDGDMGAALGEWPTGTSASAAECKDKGAVPECWDAHIAKLAAAHKKDRDHWSHELYRKLVEQRKANNQRIKQKRTTNNGKSNEKKRWGGKEEL